MAMKPEDIARLTREFEELQDQLQNLDFPEDLLSGSKKFAEGLRQSTSALKSAANAAENNADQIERLNAELHTFVGSSEERNRLQDRQTALTQIQSDLDARRLDQLRAFNETLADQSEQLGNMGAAQDLYNQAAAEYEDHLNGVPDALERYEQATRLANEASGEHAAGMEAGAAQAQALRQSLLGVSGGLQALAGFLGQGAAGMQGFGADTVKAIQSGELFVQVGLKLIETSIDMVKYQIEFALGQDKVIADFRKATGAGKEFNDMIRQTEVNLRMSGVELEESVEAYKTLKNEVVGFTNLSKDQQMAIAETTALLAEMGFSLGTQANITQTAMESMNMSVDESQQLLLDLASTARSLGTDVDKLGQDFVANKEFIVSFGKAGAEIFEGLAVQAKSLGVEIGLLTATSEKFTKFDEAGKHVGRLNAILGGPFLNSIDMMNAAMEDPAEAINMLRDAVDDAGVSLEDLGKAEKMAMADALGMSIEDMTNIMGKSSEEIEIQRIQQEELAEQARQTMEITQQLKKAFQAFYLQLGPLIEDRIVPLIGLFAKFTTTIASFAASKAGIVTFFTVVGAMFGAGIGLVLGFGAAMVAAWQAVPGVGQAIGLAFWAAVPAAFGLAGSGMAIGAMVGAGMGSLAASASGPGAAGGGGKKPKARFAAGGVVTGTTTALVGEQGPEMVEMPIGSRVTNAPTTLELTNALNKLTKKLDRINTDRGNIAVYVGDKEVTDIVIKALNSPKGKRALSPYGG